MESTIFPIIHLGSSVLKESSVKAILNKNQHIDAGLTVRVPGYQYDMYLAGFISYSKNLLIDFNDRLIVTPIVVKFLSDKYIHPIFQHIKFADNGIYTLSNKLLVNTLFDRIGAANWKNFDQNDHLTGAHVKDKLNRDWNKEGVIVKSENNIYSYVAQDNEIELTSDYSDCVSIANSFLCLCRYINPITGLPSYTLVTPDDTIVVMPKGKDD